MKKNIFRNMIILFVTLVFCLLPLISPTTSAATKYNYIANGEKDILGFKISGITQIEDCDSIEINLSANKNIVEFSTYQDVIFDGTTYNSGNHTITPTKNVTFKYEITSGNSLSPIIIYLTRIENTSCPLEIRYCNDGTVVEKVNLTLSATFYADQASDLRENKENSSGSLVQEDVIISRPNIPKEEEKPVEPKPTEPKPKPTEPKPTEPTNPDSSQENDSSTTTPPTETTPPETTPPEEIVLPIVPNGTETPDNNENPNINNDNSNDNTENDNSNTETKPPVQNNDNDVVDDDDEEKKSLLDIINGIDKIYIIIAIAVVIVLLIIVVVLIIIFTSKGSKKEGIEESQEQPIPVQEQPIPEQIPVYQPPVIEEPQQEFSPIPVVDETFLVNDDTLNNVEQTIVETPEAIAEEVSEQVNKVQTTEVEQPVIVNPEPEVVTKKVDKYEQLLLASIPEKEIELLKNEVENFEDEYNNIIL